MNTVNHTQDCGSKNLNPNIFIEHTCSYIFGELFKNSYLPNDHRRGRFTTHSNLRVVVEVDFTMAVDLKDFFSNPNGGTVSNKFERSEGIDLICKNEAQLF